MATSYDIADRLIELGDEVKNKDEFAKKFSSNPEFAEAVRSQLKAYGDDVPDSSTFYNKYGKTVTTQPNFKQVQQDIQLVKTINAEEERLNKQNPILDVAQKVYSDLSNNLANKVSFLGAGIQKVASPLDTDFMKEWEEQYKDRQNNMVGVLSDPVNLGMLLLPGGFLAQPAKTAAINAGASGAQYLLANPTEDKTALGAGLHGVGGGLLGYGLSKVFSAPVRRELEKEANISRLGSDLLSTEEDLARTRMLRENAWADPLNTSTKPKDIELRITELGEDPARAKYIAQALESRPTWDAINTLRVQDRLSGIEREQISKFNAKRAALELERSRPLFKPELSDIPGISSSRISGGVFGDKAYELANKVFPTKLLQGLGQLGAYTYPKIAAPVNDALLISTNKMVDKPEETGRRVGTFVINSAKGLQNLIQAK